MELSNAHEHPAYRDEIQALGRLSPTEVEKRRGKLITALRAYSKASRAGDVAEAKAALGDAGATYEQHQKAFETKMTQLTAHNEHARLGDAERQLRAAQNDMVANPAAALPPGARRIDALPNGHSMLYDGAAPTGGRFLEEALVSLDMLNQGEHLMPDAQAQAVLSRKPAASGQIPVAQSFIARQMIPNIGLNDGGWGNGGWAGQPQATTFKSNDNSTIEERERGIVPIPGLPGNIIDAFMNVRFINSTTLTFQRETAVPDQGGVQTEGVAVPEGSLAFADVDLKLENVAARYSVTLQALGSNADLQPYLAMRLPDKWRNLACKQLVSHATWGVKNQAGMSSVTSAKKGSSTTATYADDSIYFALLDAIGEVYAKGEASVDHFVLHPYAIIALLKELKSSEAGLFRSNLDINRMQPLEGTLFGVKLINSLNLDGGTGAAKQTYGVAGAFNMFSALYVNPVLNFAFQYGLAGRVAPNVAVGHNSDDFAKNQVSFMVADMIVPAYLRPAAICRIERAA